MNYLALLVGAYLALARQNGTVIQTNLTEWNNFKQEHGKVYENEIVETMRMVIFASNKQKIDHFNQHDPDAKSFSMGLNEFADMTDAEMEVRNGFRLPDDHKARLHAFRNSPEADKFLQNILSNDSIALPDSVDWRNEEGVVSKVKDQGMCGSCWAFATTGTLEGQERKRAKKLNGKMVELSEQNLLDCDKTDNGCGGGFMKDALDFIKSEGGIESEVAYPYKAVQQKCRFERNKAVFNASGGALLKAGDEDELKRVVATFGPVAVAIDANLFFQFYRHGVYKDKHCKNDLDHLDHAVLVVGYGSDPKQGDYWIVKNSWGAGWGEKGYIKMARNRKNMCGIATSATIPTF